LAPARSSAVAAAAAAALVAGSGESARPGDGVNVATQTPSSADDENGSVRVSKGAAFVGDTDTCCCGSSAAAAAAAPPPAPIDRMAVSARPTVEDGGGGRGAQAAGSIALPPLLTPAAEL
jgi:hypothetical protein